MERSSAPALLLAALLACLPHGPAGAEEAARVTSDTEAYCLALAERIERAADMPEAARALWLQGRAMCEHGQVRAGLARLRRATLVIQATR